jgi:hypothetical protein
MASGTFIHIKIWFLYVVFSTSLQIKESTSKLQKRQSLRNSLVFISVPSAEGKKGATPPTPPLFPHNVDDGVTFTFY